MKQKTFPSVSVLISSYNHEKYIGSAIGSVLNQTSEDLEIIVMDNGSTDKTSVEIKKIKDDRLRSYRFEENVGISRALNFGLEKAKGEYICYFGSDDIYLPEKLEKQVAYLDSHPRVGAIFSYADFINESGNIFTDENHPFAVMNQHTNQNRYKWLNYFFYKCRWLWHPSMMIRKPVYKSLGKHDPRLAQIHDFDLGMRLSLNYEIHIIQEPLVQFRIREGNMNASANTIQAQVRSMFEFAHVLKNYLTIKSVDEFLRIFPEESKRHSDITRNELIPFYIARLALTVPHVFHQKFALDTLFDLLKNPSTAGLLEKYCNFSYSDFIRLTGKYDLYHVQHIDFQENKIKILTNENIRLNKTSAQIKSLVKKLLPFVMRKKL